MKKQILPFLFLSFAFLSGAGALADNESPVSFVDPKIGSGGHGHVFVGANVPFGLVQVGPTSIPDSWDWCSGYHDSDSTVIGFSHTHLSGTGCLDLLDITVMPVVGTDLTYARGKESDPKSGIWSYADRTKETVRPGYYSVPLMRYGVTAEVTATPRVGIHRYTFPESEESAIVVDLQNGSTGERILDASIAPVGDRFLVGHRNSKGWANNQKVYFAMEFSRPFEGFKLEGADNYFARVDFPTSADEQILVKVALSPVSIEGALSNLKAEAPGWDFDNIAVAASDAWNTELSRISVSGASEKDKRIFYTALYHTMVAPSEFCDINNDYRGADDNVVRNVPFKTYTTYSLWDTYRAAMPLLSIIQPERYPDMINSMIDICDRQGRLPVWHLWACETDCMVGNPAIPVIAGAIVNNIQGIDREKAYHAIIKTAMDSIRGNGYRMQYGFIPCDLFNEAIAFDMEYALADGAAAKAAKAMEDYDMEEYFTARSHSYRNYFDPATKFMRGKDSKGEWRTPFDPFDTSHRANDYCEGNAWQYTWLVPHDVEGLVSCFGSQKEMINKLDSLFTIDSALSGENVSSDVTGLIGQYAHGNEPSHHVAYMYSRLGQTSKTADLVRKILKELYSDGPDGLSGNEDVGQMSAWYVLSALGLYEMDPGSGQFIFGTPLFEKAQIRVPGGMFTIKALGNSDKNRYVKSVKLNGKSYDKSYITYSDIMKGGELEFVMTSRKTDRPYK